MKKSGILLSISLFCFIFIAVGSYNIYRGFQSSNWPSVKGVVLSSNISEHLSSGSDRNKTKYTVSVNYQYEVSGKEYLNNTISFKGINASYSGATREVQKYPKGSNITVFYNPSKPRESVLDPGIGKSNLFLIGLPLLVWYLFFLSIRRGQIIVGGNTVSV